MGLWVPLFSSNCRRTLKSSERKEGIAACLGLFQTFLVEAFAKPVFSESSIVDVLQDPKYASLWVGNVYNTISTQ